MACTEPPWWANVLTWLSVFGGWVVVHKASLFRERRKEKRDGARCVADELSALERQAIDFHSSGLYESFAAAELRKQTERLIRRLQRLPLSELDVQTALLVRLRKSITLENIDPSNFAPQEANGQLLLNIRAAVDDLTIAIDTSKELHWQ